MDFKYNFSARKKGKGWQLVMDYKTAAGWRQKTKAGFETKRDALAYRKTLLASVESSLNIDKKIDGITFYQFTIMYLEMRTDYSELYRMHYYSVLNKMANLRDVPIKNITYVDIESEFAKMKYLGPQTRTQYRFIVKHIFKQAVKFKAISENPIAEMKAKDVSLSKKERKLRLFTKEDVQYYIDHMLDSEENLIMGICAMTGVRISEALGITWKDVDFAENEIRINKQFKMCRNPEGSKTKWRRDFGLVKNKNGNRIVHMPPSLRKALIAWSGNNVRYMDGRLTRIINPFRVNKVLKMRNPGHSCHDFRHTFATTLLAEGIDVKTIAALLGDTISTIEQTYIHYSDDMRKSAGSKLDEMFG